MARSRALGLAARPEWRKLVHYVPELVGTGVHSLVASPAFFHAPGGRTDPRAELEATLASFFSGAEETPELQHPQCAFLARRSWLDAALGFDHRRLPMRDCARYRAWRAALNPGRLTLVFAAAYLNNPSSMYGHTLLRIDARDQDERTRLLAYVVNFAADTDETNGLAFAVKGLLGGYAGAFSLAPYYLKVREYNDMENRDLWEYPLELAEHELERVLEHAWELRPAYFRYYFFDENCSYHLLGLLQVARPDLELSARFRWWALPSDTVRAVTRAPGLVSGAVHRPANATRVAARAAALSIEERDIAKQLSQGSIPAARVARELAAERAAAVLETGYDYAAYRRAIGKADVPDPARLARELLVARSALDVQPQSPRIDPGPRPDEGHGTGRFALGAGRRDARTFQELRLRPAYHDVLDADAGYVRGAEIEFFDTALRRYGQGGLRLERFVPVSILSLSARDAFFEPKSWHMAAGWRRSFLRDGADRLVAGAEGGTGASWQGAGGALYYATGDAAMRLHHDLEQGHSLGFGATLGALVDLAPRWRLHAYARGTNAVLGERDRPRALALRQSFTLGRDAALRAELAHLRESGRSFGSGSISLLLYF